MYHTLMVSIIMVMIFMGCTKPKTSAKTTVVLLNNQKIKNAVIVNNGKENKKLDKVREFVDLKDKNELPSKAKIMSEQEVRYRFGNVLRALPQKTSSILLYFELNSLVLDAPSKKLMDHIVYTIINKAPCSVDVIGHTDTVGSNQDNLKVSFLQAKRVESILEEEILKVLNHKKDITLITKGYGEEDLLVLTADNIKEEKNRNVEIFIK